MKKILIFSILTSSLFSFDMFDNTNKQIDSKDITKLLHKEVKLMDLDNTKFKILNETKYKSTGTHITDKNGVITIENEEDTLTSMTFKLKKNIWYFVRLNNENVFKFFEYTATDKKLFNQNNLYVKLLENSTNILFKTKNKFEPISFKSDEIVKFVVMDDELTPKEFSLSRIFKGEKNVK